MLRTQISLDEKEYALAKKEAKTLGISVAELVRRAVRQILPEQGPRRGCVISVSSNRETLTQAAK
jgi:hypothetical protein